MKRTIAAFATAATLATVFVPAANAMEQELNALTGAVFNALQAMTLPVDSIPQLTLDQINRIKQIMHSGDTESEKRNKIRAILAEAASR